MKQFDLNNDKKFTSGFKIPEEYFQEFEKQMLHQLLKKDFKSKPIFKVYQFWVSSAAAILFFGYLILFSISENKKQDNNENYYLLAENNITIEDIIEQLTYEDINTLEKSLKLNKNKQKTH